MSIHVTAQNVGHAGLASSRPSPLLPDVGVIGFVPEEWGGLWMPRHQVLTRLSKYFHVVWAEPPRGWRDLWFGGSPCQDTMPPDPVFHKGFVRFQSGRWHPQIYRPAILASWVANRRVHHIADTLRRRGCKSIVCYLWRPEFSYALDADVCDMSCYHIDDEYSFSSSEQPLDDHEVQLIRRVDQVFIHSPALLERKGYLNSHTLFVPNGVDYRSFADSHEEPADMREIPRPRLGYVGNLKTQLNFGLLLDLAGRHPEWSFVLVGPRGYLGDDAAILDQLSALPNVYWLGNKSVEAVGAYPQHMDVCLLPYVCNDYTKYIYPLKLHEYLASGCPVVGAPIQSLLSFQHVIKLASDVNGWESAIADALSPDAVSPDAIETRRRIAQGFDWNVLVHRIAKTMCDRLSSEQARRFASMVD